MKKIIKIKVPPTKFDIYDFKNDILDGNIICANNTDATDCDLYFQTELN